MVLRSGSTYRKRCVPVLFRISVEVEADSLADESSLALLSETSSEESIQGGLHAVKREMEEPIY